MSDETNIGMGPRIFSGRREITSSVEKIDSSNIVKVLQNAFVKHLINRDEIEYLYKYYPKAAAGTILEGSQLEVETVEAKVECEGCHGHYRPTRENGYRCPDCGDARGRVIDGRDVRLERIEILSLE